MNRRILFSFAGILALSATFAQGDPEVNKRIIDIGKNQNQVMKHLDTLTHRIGPRLTGSPGMERSMTWFMDQFKAIGCQNVHLEQWGEWPVGFQREVGERRKAAGVGRSWSEQGGERGVLLANQAGGAEGGAREESVR